MLCGALNLCNLSFLLQTLLIAWCVLPTKPLLVTWSSEAGGKAWCADAEERRFAQGLHSLAGPNPAPMEAADKLCPVRWDAGKPRSVPQFP